METTLIARCVVETNGTLGSCQMVKSHRALEQSLLAFLKKARVTPFTTTDGVKVRVACNYVFRYKLE